MDDVIAQLKRAIEDLDQLDLTIAAAHVAAALDYLHIEQARKATLTRGEHMDLGALERPPLADYH